MVKRVSVRGQSQLGPQPHQRRVRGGGGRGTSAPMTSPTVWPQGGGPVRMTEQILPDREPPPLRGGVGGWSTLICRWWAYPPRPTPTG